MMDWAGWCGRRWPVLFSSNSGDDELEYDGGGWYNVSEVKLACDYAMSLVQSNLIEQKDICIMSPFSTQVKRLRQTIRREPYRLSGVNIGPMEAYQGLESRFVIICTTRTRPRFLPDDLARGLGMIHEPLRFNVATTRAMQGLIAIGNPWLLSQDPVWAAFLTFCRRHGLWEEDPAGGESDALWMPEGSSEEILKVAPGLERRLVVKEEEYEGTDERVYGAGDEDAMWVAGIAAEQEFDDSI
jgi:hypothetical protein